MKNESPVREVTIPLSEPGRKTPGHRWGRLSIAGRAGILALWFSAHAFGLATDPPKSSQPESDQTAAASSLGRGNPERSVSWKELPSNFLQDQKAIWTFPLHLAQGKHWKPALGFVVTTAALVSLDPHDTPHFRRTNAFADFNKGVSGRNTSIGMAVLPATFYVASLARKDSYAQHTALLAGEAVVGAEILTVVMKDVSRRVRPSDIPAQGNFSDTWFDAPATAFGKRSSFPSGHTIEAFAIATIFAERYRQHRWVPWVSYGLAGLVGFSRVSLQAHFPSDVFAGAAVGYFIAHGVVLRNH